MTSFRLLKLPANSASDLPQHKFGKHTLGAQLDFVSRFVSLIAIPFCVASVRSTGAIEVISGSAVCGVNDCAPLISFH
jgi:hypothetical protein